MSIGAHDGVVSTDTAPSAATISPATSPADAPSAARRRTAREQRMKRRSIKPLCLWSLIAAAIVSTGFLWRRAEAPPKPVMGPLSAQLGLCDRFWSLHNYSCKGRLIVQMLWRGPWSCSEWPRPSPRPSNVITRAGCFPYDPREEFKSHVGTPFHRLPIVRVTSTQTEIREGIDGGCSPICETCMESYWAPARTWTVSCTAWLPFALSLAFAGLVGGRAYYRYRRRHWSPRHAHCVKCGYDLTGNLSGRCPECGTPVPPAAAVEPRTGK